MTALRRGNAGAAGGMGLVFVAMAVMTSAVAGPVLAQGDRGNPNWYVRFAPSAWFSNIDGAVTLGVGEDEQIVGDFVLPVGDTLLVTDWAIRAEVGKGRWRALMALAHSGVANSGTFHRVSDPQIAETGNYNLDWLSAEVFAAVQVGPFRPERGVEIYVGGRYVRIGQDVVVTGVSPIEAEESWIDPVLGGRFFTEMGGPFWAMFNGDLGGWGVGSEFTLTLGGELGIRAGKSVDFTLRYSYQEFEYDNGKSGNDAFVWENGAVQGWFLGLALKY